MTTTTTTLFRTLLVAVLAAATTTMANPIQWGLGVYNFFGEFCDHDMPVSISSGEPADFRLWDDAWRVFFVPGVTTCSCTATCDADNSVFLFLDFDDPTASRFGRDLTTNPDAWECAATTSSFTQTCTAVGGTTGGCYAAVYGHKTASGSPWWPRSGNEWCTITC